MLVAVVRELARLGFDPLAEHHDNETEVVMRHCPMAAAATRSPEIVCELHRGILEGMAAVIGGAEVTSFLPGDPHAGRCHVTLTSRRA